MGLATTFILYLVIGAAVAAAVLLRESPPSTPPLMTGLSVLFFWPLYVPALLSDSGQQTTNANVSPGNQQSTDELSAAIERVESELEQALHSLDGWAESTLAAERSRLDELQQTWRLQAHRIRELDELLEDPAIEAELSFADPAAAGAVPAQRPASRTAQTERSRRDNIVRLRQIRRQLHDDLLASLAWVRELVTMIHLARYTGAPASRAEELVAQIAAAVEGLSAVSAWDEGQTEVA
jgi:hypothetical protein